MRVHVDTTADAAARAHRADAVTVGTDVHFRSGRFRPETAEGLALLAHEASHVTTLLDRGRPDHGNTPTDRQAQEVSATRIERLARRGVETDMVPGPIRRADTSNPGSAAPPRGGAAATTVSPSRGPMLPTAETAATSAMPVNAAAATPMRADVDRERAAVPAHFDLESLRRSLIDDLMSRLRTDSERGG